VTFDEWIRTSIPNSNEASVEDEMRRAWDACESSNSWKDAIDNEMVCAHIGVANGSARECLHKVINWHVMVALDPCVSSSAEALIQSGRDEAKADLLPERLVRFTLRDLRIKRQRLEGFLSIGNEVGRAKEYDEWIAALEAYCKGYKKEAKLRDGRMTWLKTQTEA